MPYDYFIPLFLFLIVTMGSAYYLSKNFEGNWQILFAIAFISLVPKYEALTEPYYGTEYEDAFVFQADSKSLTEHSSEADRFRIQISNYNIEENGEELLSYTGHFTSFSSILGAYNKIFGYSRYRAIQLNLLFSVLLSFVIFSIFRLQTNSTLIGVTSILLLASSPATNLFQTSGLTETFSSLALAIALYLFLFLWRDKRVDHRKVIIFLSALFLCLLIKRENMVLLVILPFVVYRLYDEKSFRLILIVGVSLATYFVGVEPFSTEYLEAQSIQTSTFSVSYLFVQLPAYLSAFLKFKFFGAGLVFLILTMIWIGYKRLQLSFESLLSLGLFILFLAIYCLHYRSRYFVLSMEMSDFETFRYANNFYFLLILAVGFNLRTIWMSMEPKKRLEKIVAVLFGVIFVFSIPFSLNLRNDLQSGEFQTRILPLLESQKIISEISAGGQPEVLITDIPLVGRMLEEDEFSLLIHEFNAENDYLSYSDKNRLYFLIPRETAERHFLSKIDIIPLPLGNQSGHILFQLP